MRSRGALKGLRGARGDLRTFSKSSQRAIRNRQRAAQDQWIQVDPEINTIVFEWISIAAPALANVIETQFFPVADHAHKQAPEDSGQLKAAQSMTLQKDGESIRVRFTSAAPYTFFVRYVFLRPLDRFQNLVLSVMRSEYGVPVEGTPTEAQFREAARRFKVGGGNVGNGASRIRGWWRRRQLRRQSFPYRLPDGTTAEAKPYWSRQAVRPFNKSKRGWAKMLDRNLQQGVRDG